MHQINTLGAVQGWGGGYFEVYDSPCDVARGLNSNCFVPVGGGQRDGVVDVVLTQTSFCVGSCVAAASDFTREELMVHVRSERFAHEIQWRLDDTSMLPISTNAVYENHQDYFTSVSVASGPHNFAYFDAYGDGWHGGYFELFYDGLLILGGQTDGMVQNAGGESSFCVGSATACPEPTQQSVPINITIHTAVNANEITWQLDGGPVNGMAPGPFYADNAVYHVEMVVQPGEHQMYCFDSYGDGWQGGYWEVRDGCGAFLAGGEVDGRVDHAGAETTFMVPNTTHCLGSHVPGPAQDTTDVSAIVCGQTSAESTNDNFGRVGSERIFQFDASATYNYGFGVYHFGACNLGAGVAMSVYTQDLQTKLAGCSDCIDPITGGCHFVDTVLEDGGTLAPPTTPHQPPQTALPLPQNPRYNFVPPKLMAGPFRGEN